MKNILMLITLLSFSFLQAQTFTGKGDKKIQVGANFQDNATGVFASFDLGLGDNLSVGVSSSYALGINNNYVEKAFVDRFDVKARASANIGNIINIDDSFDIYPGLNLGLKNFGAHLGARYFFTDGIGFFTELNLPIAKYKPDGSSYSYQIHNQFSVNAGVVFNLN